MTKKQLDTIMTEYYYQKNTIEDTINFLEYMRDCYLQLWYDKKHKNEKKLNNKKGQ